MYPVSDGVARGSARFATDYRASRNEREARPIGNALPIDGGSACESVSFPLSQILCLLNRYEEDLRISGIDQSADSIKFATDRERERERDKEKTPNPDVRV